MESSGHWYTKEGKSAHTQPTKKGAKNPERATTIADARRLGLLPSVTSILKVVYNPPLERWKMGKVIEACVANPIGGLDLDTYKAKIMDCAFDEATDAADLGTRIHANIEAYLKSEPMPHFDDVDLAVDAIKKLEELQLRVVESEFVAINRDWGYAGKADLAFTRGEQCGILDFKSTKTVDGEPVLQKFGHAAQIAAYHSVYWLEGGGTFRDNHIGYNIYISTTEPGRIDVVEYDHATLQAEYEMFISALRIWKHKNAYDPAISLFA